MERVMLCQRGEWGRFPRGWIYEPKIDGSRCLAVKREGEVSLVSRRGDDYTVKFPEVVESLKNCPDLVLDGEIACQSYLQTSARTHLTNTFLIQLRSRLYPATYYAFDLLYLQGRWLVGLPLKERKRMLESLTFGERVVVVKPEPLEALVEKALKGEVEGLVAKDPESRYELKRSERWIKFRPEKTEELPVVGWEDTDKPNRPYRSLILLYQGKEVQASSGMSEEDLRLTSEIFASKPHRKVGTKNYFEGGHFEAEVRFFSQGETPYRFPRIVRLKLDWIPNSGGN